MKHTRRLLSAFLLLVGSIGLLPGSDRAVAELNDRPVPVVQVPAQVLSALSDAQAQGKTAIDMEFTVDVPEDMPELTRAVQAVGGQVLVQEQTFVRARVPVSAAMRLPGQARVAAVGVDTAMTTDSCPAPKVPSTLNSADAQALSATNYDPMGLAAFRSQHGVTGTGLTVAIVDTGIDPGHPDLLRTPDGATKIVDWKDFTGEGQVSTPYAVPWGATYTAPDGRTYTLPPGTSRVGNNRFGYWEETKITGVINRDLDRNGNQNDKFGVLLVDSTGSGRFDTVYVDSNDDRDFGDEVPMKVYRLDHSVAHMGRLREGRLADRRTNIVVADVDPQGTQVTFGFDGHGHGTEVAGVVGAYNPTGFQGAAPGVKLMALKAVSSADDSSWYSVSTAIEYAAQHGANIINVSLQGLVRSAAYDPTASEFLDNLARKYGVLIVLAAGNTGPGLSSGATLGSSAQVLSVGSYYSPEMYKRDFGYVVPDEGVWVCSGMGPRADGAYLPTLVAPGGAPTTSPRWLDESGYTLQTGTSVATPHVSAAAALLMETGRKEGAPSDRLSVERALEMGARFLDGYGPMEQGHGLVTLEASLSRLRQITASPNLDAGVRGGGEGILARSYRPGGTDLWLLNRDPAMTRVNLVSSDSWLKLTSQSLTLPSGVARQVGVEVNPPSTPGVHSAFVIVSQTGQYAPSVTIPVTFVQPINLNAANHFTDTQVDQLSVTRFKRYFYTVPSGTQDLSISLEMPTNPADGKVRGNVRVQVFRPDGQAVFQSGVVGTQGLKTSPPFHADAPVPGVWEIVVTSVPGQAGTDLDAVYSLTTQVTPGISAKAPLEFSQAVGERKTYDLTLTNSADVFTGKVEAVGLSKTDLSVPWKVMGKPGVIDDFTTSEFMRTLRVEIANPSPTNIDLDLQVYRYEPSINDFTLVRQATTAGSARELIELDSLPAGRYQVVVMPNGYLPTEMQYQYRRLVAVQSYQADVTDQVRRHEPNQSWQVRLSIQAPSSPGRYTGYLIARDADGTHTVAWLPFTVSVGQPALDVQPLASEVQTGRQSYVTLELRNAQSRALVDTMVTVNGQQFYTHNGQVTVPLNVTGPTASLSVEVDDLAFQPLHKVISVPVQDHWGLHPIGADPSEELAGWRRKVMTQISP